ncbi:bifunctional DNA primase/polymerase [Gordonia terrae]
MLHRIHLDVALGYAERGIGVFPLKPRSKVPATRNGLHDATCDPAVIRHWWRPTQPAWNIAVRPPTHLIVLDVDPRAGGSLDDLGSIPTTRIASTGGGGWHVWFRYSGRVRGKLAGADGIDIKGNNGYLVAPPSIHPNGREYRWEIEHPAAVLPDHLVERVAPPSQLDRGQPVQSSLSTPKCSGLVRTVAEAGDGNRNHALFWAACRAVEGGADPAVFGELLHAAVNAGLSDREAERTIQSARRKAS